MLDLLVCLKWTASPKVPRQLWMLLFRRRRKELLLSSVCWGNLQFLELSCIFWEIGNGLLTGLPKVHLSPIQSVLTQLLNCIATCIIDETHWLSIHLFRICLYCLFNSSATQRCSQLQIDTVSELTYQSATGSYEWRTCPRSLWRLEWDSNQRPSGCKTPNLPLSHCAPQLSHCAPTIARLLRYSCIVYLYFCWTTLAAYSWSHII